MQQEISSVFILICILGVFCASQYYADIRVDRIQDSMLKLNENQHRIVSQMDSMATLLEIKKRAEKAVK